MLVKIDEDLPSDLCDVLERFGYGAATVVGQGWSGLPDDELIERLNDERVYFVTADRDFGELQVVRMLSDCGVVLLRLHRESLAGYINLFSTLLTQVRLAEHQRAFIVAEPGNIRIRERHRT